MNYLDSKNRIMVLRQMVKTVLSSFCIHCVSYMRKKVLLNLNNGILQVT